MLHNEVVMEAFFDNQVQQLYEKASNIIGASDEDEINIPEDFRREFFALVDKVNLNLMEDKDNFFGYFLFQMSREIRFDISSPTAVNFKGAKYVIYFNPVIFLTLNIKQMETTIKHEILHVLALHLVRGKEYKERYSSLAINMAMDVVVNQFLDYLPPYATTLERVNMLYGLRLERYKPFEYYLDKLQIAIALLEADEDAAEDDSIKDDRVETEFSPERTHDIWEDSSEIDEKTLREFTERFADSAKHGKSSAYLESLLKTLKSSKGELPWNVYLSRLMGTLESNRKKTITRRNRRQPDRLELRGELRSHKTRVIVALDISGSISDEEFIQAVKEVLQLVKAYNHEITIVECDDEIRRVYKASSEKDVRERLKIRGSTKFTPVFEYANQSRANLLVYFTDGKGEDRLTVRPSGYKVLWVISGRGDKLSVKEPYGIVKKLKQVEIKEDNLDMSDVKRDGYSMNSQESTLWGLK
jgi:predicted metal-dependent peptidase